MNDTDWSAQTAEMMRSWSEAQRTMLAAWVDMLQDATQKTPSFADMALEWQQLATQSLQAWSAAADPIVRSTAEQFVASQGLLLRFVDFAAKAWETAAPKLQSAEDWQAALSDSMEQLRQSWLGLPDQAAAITEDMDALWELYLDQWRAFGQPWESVWSKTPGLMGQTIAGESAAFFELSDSFQQAYQQTLGRLAGSPNLGLTREFISRLQEGFDAFVSLNLANVEYQAVMTEIWDEAFKQFGADIATLVEKDEKVETIRDLVLLWTRGAERTFLEAFQTKRYTLSQGKLLNATMKYRISQRRIMEEVLELFDLPTRSEVDEAHRRIYELRKDVKTLTKQVNQLEGKTNPATTVPQSKGPKAR